VAQRDEAPPGSHHDQVKRISNSIAKDAGSSPGKGKLADAGRLNGETGRLIQETAEDHAQIGDVCAKLPDDGLLWLAPRQEGSRAGRQPPGWPPRAARPAPGPSRAGRS
jgi:hypothetical protein